MQMQVEKLRDTITCEEITEELNTMPKRAQLAAAFITYISAAPEDQRKDSIDHGGNLLDWKRDNRIPLSRTTILAQKPFYRNPFAGTVSPPTRLTRHACRLERRERPSQLRDVSYPLSLIHSAGTSQAEAMLRISFKIFNSQTLPTCGH
ncbi:unnamed protein product, partial [Ranitomeya imitator]